MKIETPETSNGRPVSGLAGGGFRLEIQGLRAVAVLLVAIYHIWPTSIPGGYIGVDVFFVISGYLITGLLLRELERDGRVSMLGFYGRRIRRLLPAATVTLLGVVVGSLFLMPEAYWRDTAVEVIASALYVQNWWLAFQAVDYLGAETAASPVQHFWSLSVEEQYYLVWPWLLAASSMAARYLSTGRLRVFSGLLVLVGGASLSHSIWLTYVEPDFAYFATTTRVWELALGGGVAVLMRSLTPSAPLGRGLRVLGVGMILAAAFLFSYETQFPGYTALLPTVGTALVIIAGADSRAYGLYPTLASKPSQFIGGISYSLYLWHWPVIVFYGYQFGDATPGLLHGIALLLIAIVLAYASKALVEDRFIKRREAGGPWRPYALGAACVAMCGIAAAGQLLVVDLRSAAAGAKVAAGEPAPGARVMGHDFEHHFVPSLASVRKDSPEVDERCHGTLKSDSPDFTCVFGPDDAEYTLAVLGDSHAWHWVPTLLELAEPLNMKVTLLTKSACPFTTATLARKAGDYIECRTWNERVLSHLVSTRPDLVFTSASSGIAARREKGESSAEVIAEGFGELWSTLAKESIGVMAMRDTPRFRGDKRDAVACLSDENNRPADCVVERERAVQDESKDAIAMAALTDPRVTYVDLTDHICNRVACEPVVGGVLVWRDRHHLTATFAKTLAPALEPKLRDALKQDKQQVARDY